MIFLFGLLYAVFAFVAVGSFLWGIGSGMMNGIRYSSLGECLVISVVSAVLSAGSFQIARILLDSQQGNAP